MHSYFMNHDYFIQVQFFTFKIFEIKLNILQLPALLPQVSTNLSFLFLYSPFFTLFFLNISHYPTFTHHNSYNPSISLAY